MTSYLGNQNNYNFAMRHPLFNFWTSMQKFSFDTTQELVKFHVFHVPGGSIRDETYHMVSIIFESLSPHLYPMIYLNKIEEEENAFDSLADLKHPSRAEHDFAFGENPFHQVGKAVQTYKFIGLSTAPYTYYTMAIYQENWGLTELLKSDYQILVSVTAVDDDTIQGDEEMV